MDQKELLNAIETISAMKDREKGKVLNVLLKTIKNNPEAKDMNEKIARTLCDAADLLC